MHFKTLNLLMFGQSIFYDFLLIDQVTKNLATISPSGLVPVDTMVIVLLSPGFNSSTVFSSSCPWLQTNVIFWFAFLWYSALKSTTSVLKLPLPAIPTWQSAPVLNSAAPAIAAK